MSLGSERVSHCLPNIARKAEKSEAPRPMKRMACTWTIVRGVVGGVVSERGVVNLVDKDTKENGGLVVWIQLYFRNSLNG